MNGFKTESNNKSFRKKTNTRNVYNNYQDFIGAHSMSKEDTREITNTRISGGKFHIPDEEYEDFLKMYYNDIVKPGYNEHLTEKQRDTGGPIVIDLDFRYDYSIKTRQHNIEIIHTLVLAYLDELSKMFQFNSQQEIMVYIQEKPDVNCIQDKQITKDGVHILFGIQADRVQQSILRDNIIKVAPDILKSLPLTNTIEDVFDKGISEGHVNWQLFGSCKPDHGVYGLTHVYKFEYDPDDGEFIETKENHKKFDWANNFHKLSVRYTGNASFFMKTDFITEYEKVKQDGGGKRSKMKRTVSKSVIELRSISDIMDALEQYKENLKPTEYEERETIEYVMALPVSYYGAGSYSKWIRVGWALANKNKGLFIAWLAFSAQSSEFTMDKVDDLRVMWNDFENNNKHGLTQRSILYWVHQDAPEKFKEIRDKSIDYQLDLSIRNMNMFNAGKNQNYGCGDTDIAKILNMMYKQDFACAGIKADKWYRFSNHRWVEDECGTTLRKGISGDLRDLYRIKADEMSDKICHGNLPDDKLKIQESISNKIVDILTRLSSTTHKDHILKEARELFYDANTKFVDLLDSKPYLMCFNNGVIDFKEKVFRKGRAEDYLEKSTNINYVPLDRKRDAVVINEINDFMVKLFPLEKLRNYMWEHFASILIGVNLNQKLHMYIGGGENGKSVLTDLLSQCLGDYCSTVPLSLITQARQKQGQASPDIVALKGLRLALMQEPSKDDRINDGAMKELTSCVEPIKGRNLFSTPITFIPQCKIVICSNNFMKVNSQDHGTWRRIAVADFMSLFTEKPAEGDNENPYQYKKDPTLKERFPVWREVFMAMLVEKAFELQGRVKQCDLVDKASDSYRQREDHIAEFIAEKIRKDADGRLTKTELTGEFNLWYRSTYGRDGPSIKEVHEYLNKKFSKCKDGSWYGIKYRYDEVRNNEDGDGEDDDDDEADE
jgi:P4 family phage/plasmid primase-like protien